MKNKKKLIKRIGAVLCALVVAVSSLSMSGTFYGYSDDYSGNDACVIAHSRILKLMEKSKRDMPNDAVLPTSKNGYEYCLVGHSNGYVYVLYTEQPIVGKVFVDSSSGRMYCNLDINIYNLRVNYEVYSCSSSSGSLWSLSSWKNGLSMDSFYSCVEEYDLDSPLNSVSYSTSYDYYIYYCNYALRCDNSNLPLLTASEVYNASLGYLQNVRVENQYLRGEVSIGGVDLPLYYDDALDTLKRVWKFDTVSSSGVDLSSGYSVRHYIKMATVEGYDKEDIIEMSDMYLMGEYDASVGRLEYMEKDYDEKLVQLGYEELGFFDTVFKGLFTLQHHYFQIVNTSTNEVGGYLHVFPQNKDGDFSFEVFGNEGVELGFEGLDENLNVDTEAPSGEVGESVGHGDTYEDAEQQAQETQLRIEGMDQFVLSVESYASQVGNVSKGVGAFLGSLPPWVLGLFGLGVAITFIVIVIKGIRG